MTSEYLLDAIGLLDDDLIQDAEILTPSRPQIIWQQFRLWLPTAACVALLLIALPFLRAGGGESAAPSAGDAAAEDYESLPSASSPASSVPSGQETPGTDRMQFCVYITMDGLTYTYSHSYPLEEAHGTLIETLPEGCLPVGTVTPIDEDVTIPHTDIGVYEGCTLWLEGTGKESTLYLELPQGGYLVCEYSQTHDFSPDGRG